MKYTSSRAARCCIPPMRSGGFSLLEIMIALALGLLLSIGIVTLFGGTSHTNKVQDGLARLQENGRFAITRMEQDLRMFAGQYCSNTEGAAVPGTDVPMMPSRAPMVYAPSLKLPDSKLQSIDADGNPVEAPAASSYILSPRWFLQGYSCGAAACDPVLPSGTGQIPAMGLAEGLRVPASDVLTLRYQRGTGWPLGVDTYVGASAEKLEDGATFSVVSLPGNDPVDGLTPGLALVSDCVSPAILPISAVAGTTLTIGAAPDSPGGILQGAPVAIARGNATRDVRVFNFSKDFVTVSYYLAFRGDDNPDARANSTAARRLIPVLIRRENGVEQELVRGVDQMEFRYLVQDASGASRFMSAAEVEANSVDGTCLPQSAGLKTEPGCLWRTVRMIEPHLLLNTVDEIFGLDTISRSYRFNGDSHAPGDADPLPSGLKAGAQMRREFIAYVSGRNRTL